MRRALYGIAAFLLITVLGAPAWPQEDINPAKIELANSKVVSRNAEDVVPRVAADTQSAECASLAASKTSVYGFHPTDLQKNQQTAKSAQLDKFWSEVRADGPAGVSCLREMILAEKTDTFFLFDASHLLYSLDKSPESLNAIVKGVGGADLKDLQIPDYVEFLLLLSRDGVDTGPLAAKYLYYPKVDAYLPIHSMTLDRNLGAIILYGCMPPDRVDQYLVPALTAQQGYVRSTAALILAMNMTPADFKALRAVKLSDFPDVIQQQIENTLKPGEVPPLPAPKFTREQVLGFLRQVPDYDEKFEGVGDNDDFISSAMGTLKEGDLEALDKARQKSIMGVSDEAIDEYVALSLIKLSIIVRLNLYANVRGTAGGD
ncbi:MAG TPA: hypothetical protein VGZ48_05470 [Candidatus Acidoferrales bacterium]|jgi:hypothetical protein|nr:hypothetical protein [Candidatus Acidoferrales bacterium]